MRITDDKNGDPFGFCEAKCRVQMRVGGDAQRVKDFYANPKHAHIKKPVTDTAPVATQTAPKQHPIATQVAPKAPAPAHKPVHAPAPAPVPEPKPVPDKPMTAMASALGVFGFKK